MSLIKQGDKFRFHKYIVKEIYLLFKTETIKIDPVRVNGFTIIDDYIENCYPILKLDIALEDEIYYKIQRHKKTVQVKLRVQRFYREGTEKEKSLCKDYIKSVFSLILDDDDEDLSEGLRKKEYPNGESGNLAAVTTTMEMFLFKSSIIRANRKMQNKIFTKTDVTHVITWLLQKAGVKNALISRVENQNTYDEIIIPPMSILEDLAQVDSFYGIHKTGTIIYFGLDRSYVIKFLAESKTFVKGEKHTVTIIVPKKGSSETDNVSEVRKKGDTEKIYILADPNSFEPKNLNETDSALHAIDVDIVDAGSGSVQSTGEENKQVIINPGLNPFYKTLYNAKKKSNECVVSIGFQDVDVSCLTPNKNYRFLFEDTKLSKKYHGSYMLCGTTMTFVKEGKEFTAVVSAIFRKIK